MRDDDRPAVLGGVADDRHDHGRDEEVRRCAFSANVSIEPTRISAISAVTTVAAASTPTALDNALILVSSSAATPREVPARAATT